MFTTLIRAFCESDGNGGWVASMRRILAFMSFIAFAVLAYIAIKSGVQTWYVFIPSALSLAAMLFLMFFTTWSDVASVVSAASSKDKPQRM